MSKAANKSLRQIITNMHTWVGLPLGWLFFFIFVMGALSFYHQEITLWMQPEAHKARPAGQTPEGAAQKAFEALRREAPDSVAWTITLPNERTPYATASWRDPAMAQQGGRAAMKRLAIDPASGETLTPRQTAGGGFLYRMHVQLFGLERSTGISVIAVSTLLLLLALVSGLFAHRAIFKDFFMFRPGRGRLSWRDAHNATAVLAYPFHIVITLSGLLLICSSLMSPVININYGNDSRSFIMATRGFAPAQATGAPVAQKQNGKEAGREAAQKDLAGQSGAEGTGHVLGGAASGRRRQAEPAPKAENTPDGMTNIAPMLRQALERWPQGAGSLVINNPPNPTVELRQAKPDTLRGGGGATEKMTFDAESGELLHVTEKSSPGAVMSVWQSITALHRGHFAGPLARFLLFASGLCGAGMAASGLIMWSMKRGQNGDPLHRMVESLNIAAIPGLFMAIGCFWAASRIIPADITTRSDFEKQVFFIVWVIALLHALLRGNKKQAWAEQLAAAGTVFALLPLINAVTGGAHLASSLANALWPIAGFDVMALLFGATFLLAAKKIVRHAATGGTTGAKSRAIQLTPAHPAQGA